MEFLRYHNAELCGRTLAHGHASTGETAKIAGYMGKSDTFAGKLEVAHLA
jgi:hypothetical protein